MNMHGVLILPTTLTLLLSSLALSYDTPKLLPGVGWTGVEHTSAKLKGGQAIKIVYFGQSIISATGVENWWPDTVTAFLRTKYPKATITAVNAAISGCDAKCMLDNDYVAAKLAPLNPDCILLSIYFHYENQMEALIRQIGEKLPNAEVAMVNFHYSCPKDSRWSASGRKSEVPWEDALSWDYLPWLCWKYHLGYIDIRTSWIRYMADFNGGSDNLTNPADGIHLNPQGQWLMAESVKRYFSFSDVVRDIQLPGIGKVTGMGSWVAVQFYTEMDSLYASNPALYSLDGGSVRAVAAGYDDYLNIALLSLPSSLSAGQHTLSVPNPMHDAAGNQFRTVSDISFVSESLPAGWQSVDIGRVFTPGKSEAGSAADEFRVSGGGELASPMGCAWSSLAEPCAPKWIWRNEFQYHYQYVSGDFTLTAQISAGDKLNDYSQAGIIIRENLQYLSRFAALCTFKKDGGNIDFVARNTPDSITFVQPRTAKNSATWLRLKRTGTSIEAFISNDDTSWSGTGTVAVPMFAQVTTGLFVCGNEYGSGPWEATFSHVTIERSTLAVRPGGRCVPNTSPVIRFTGNVLTIQDVADGCPAAVSLFDCRGRRLWKGTVFNGGMNYHLPFPPGVYTIGITDNGQTIFCKAVACR